VRVRRIQKPDRSVCSARPGSTGSGHDVRLTLAFSPRRSTVRGPRAAARCRLAGVDRARPRSVAAASASVATVAAVRFAAYGTRRGALVLFSYDLDAQVGADGGERAVPASPAPARRSATFRLPLDGTTMARVFDPIRGPRRDRQTYDRELGEAPRDVLAGGSRSSIKRPIPTAPSNLPPTHRQRRAFQWK
jgi:hypothetical protein